MDANSDLDLKEKLELALTENKLYKAFVKQIAFSNGVNNARPQALELLSRIDHINKV